MVLCVCVLCLGVFAYVCLCSLYVMYCVISNCLLGLVCLCVGVRVFGLNAFVCFICDVLCDVVWLLCCVCCCLCLCLSV